MRAIKLYLKNVTTSISNSRKITNNDLARAGLMVSFSFVLTLISTLSFGTSGVYLMGISILLMPFILPTILLIPSVAISVIFADLMAGYIAYTTESLAAYFADVMMIWIFVKKLKFKHSFFIASIIGAGLEISIYYFITYALFNKAQAISDAMQATVENIIVLPIVNIFYKPFLYLAKGDR